MLDNSVSCRLLLEFIAEPEGENDQMWWGYVLAVSLFLVSVSESMCYSHYLYVSLNLGRRISATLMSALYKKVGRKSIMPTESLGHEFVFFSFTFRMYIVTKKYFRMFMLW
jgi:hypothetical protein